MRIETATQVLTISRDRLNRGRDISRDIDIQNDEHTDRWRIRRRWRPYEAPSECVAASLARPLWVACQPDEG